MYHNAHFEVYTDFCCLNPTICFVAGGLCWLLQFTNSLFCEYCPLYFQLYSFCLDHAQCVSIPSFHTILLTQAHECICCPLYKITFIINNWLIVWYVRPCDVIMAASTRGRPALWTINRSFLEDYFMRCEYWEFFIIFYKSTINFFM